MNPVATALTAGMLIILGKWARNQPPNIDNAVGVAGIAVGLAVLEQINDRLGKAFGVLILISVSFVHLPVIVKAAGFSKGTS